MKNIKLIFNNNKKEITKVNLYTVYLILSFVPYMIPLFIIEPFYLCKTSELEDIFNTCPIEKICKEEFYKIDDIKSFITLKYEYLIQNHFIDYCNKEFQLQEIMFKYFNIFYLIGIRLAIFLFKKFISDGKIFRKMFLIANLMLNLILIVFINYGLNTGLFLVFSVNSGFCFYLLSIVALDQYLSCFKGIDKKQKQNLLNQLNMMTAIGAIAHISVFIITKTWRSNAIIYVIVSTFTILLAIIHNYNIFEESLTDGNSGLDKIDEEKSFNEKREINASYQERYEINVQTNDIPSDKNSMKTFSQKYYFELFLLFVLSINYQFFNYYYHIFSYSEFDTDLNPIFINGISIFLSELFSLFFRDFFFKLHKYKTHFAISGILLLAILLTIMEVCKENKFRFLILPFLILAKILSTLLYLKFLEKFNKPKGNFYKSKSQTTLINISHLSVILASFYLNYVEQSLLVLACIYYFLFILYFKLI